MTYYQRANVQLNHFGDQNMKRLLSDQHQSLKSYGQITHALCKSRIILVRLQQEYRKYASSLWSVKLQNMKLNIFDSDTIKFQEVDDWHMTQVIYSNHKFTNSVSPVMHFSFIKLLRLILVPYWLGESPEISYCICYCAII